MSNTADGSEFEDPEKEADFQEFRQIKDMVCADALDNLRNGIGSRLSDKVETVNVMAICCGLVEAASMIARNTAKQGDLSPRELVSDFVLSYAQHLVDGLSDDGDGSEVASKRH